MPREGRPGAPVWEHVSWLPPSLPPWVRPSDSIRLRGTAFFSLLCSSPSDCFPSHLYLSAHNFGEKWPLGLRFSSVWSLSTGAFFFFFFKETSKRLHLHFKLELWVKAFLFYRKLSRCRVILGGQGGGRVDGDRRRDKIEERHLEDFSMTWSWLWLLIISLLWERHFGKLHRKLVKIPTNHTILIPFSSLQGWEAGAPYPLLSPHLIHTHCSCSIFGFFPSALGSCTLQVDGKAIP